MGKRHTDPASRPKGTLQAKILSGYLLLTLLVGGIVYAVWYEKQVFEEAEQEERAMLEQRKTTNAAFKGLISLFLHSDGATLWGKEELRLYETEDKRVRELLEGLRGLYPDSLQQSRIDTVEMLLAEKKRQIRSLAEAPSTANRMDSLLNERLPPLEQSASMPGRVTVKEPEQSGNGKKAKKSFWNWLRPKKNRETGQEYTGTSHVTVSPNFRHIRDMRQFRKEVFDALEEQKRIYRALSDSLERRNRRLNLHINRLVNDFEHDAMLRAEERLARVASLREQAFALICGISSAGLLCALLLYVFIYRDIRRKYRNRCELEEAHRKGRELLEMRKRIIVTLSHDIRGPLNAIGGSAELAMDTKDRKRRNAYLTDIVDSSRHIARLANSLLDLSRLDEAKETLNNVPFRLAPFLKGFVERYTRMANDKGLLFLDEIRGTEVTVFGDADRIGQVIDNVLSNAVKFTKAGNVSLSAMYGNGTLSIQISDTGIGMDECTVQRIFRPFERAAPDIDSEGFGLGLSIVKGLVTLLDGRITVVSHAGEGSTFGIRIPLPTTGETAQDCVTVAGVETRLPQRVLVVDDDPMQLRIVGEMLERNGICSHTCLDAREVVARLREGKYDLLLADIQMRGTSGFDLLRLLRHSNIGDSRSIPVVAMTARNDDDEARYTEAGFSGRIRKPFSMSELLAFLSSVAGNGRLERDPRPDFETLAEAAGDRQWMLSTFIAESQKDKAELLETLRLADMDLERLKETLHRMYPVWEQLGIAHELEAYHEVLHESGSDSTAVRARTEAIIRRIQELVREAETLSAGTGNKPS